MVTITGYRTRYTTGGDKKIYLQVEGGVKTTVSQNSGKAYLSTLKASVFAAVDEEVAKAMIGHQLPGTIKQLQVEPYQIVNDETGEVEEPPVAADGEEKEKRGRGRPRTRPLPAADAPKRGRGRPRTRPEADPTMPKRGRGRPKKVREWIDALKYVAEGKK